MKVIFHNFKVDFSDFRLGIWDFNECRIPQFYLNFNFDFVKGFLLVDMYFGLV